MFQPFISLRQISSVVACLCTMTLAGCMVGPEYKAPYNKAPQDWSSWSSADPSLALVDNEHKPLPNPWWKSFEDPVLEGVIQHALNNSLDLKTAALHFAEARVQREGTASQLLPTVGASSRATRQRQSEHNASTRLYDALGSNTQSPLSGNSSLAQLLSDPYTSYQAGFDASWEPDFWGKVRRSLEADEANFAQQRALFRLARVSLISDVASHYFTLRATQQRINVLRSDIEVLRQRIELVNARYSAGRVNQLDLDRQQAQLNALTAQLPTLLASEAHSINQIALLSGEHPGALRDALTATAANADDSVELPDLSLGVPSELAQQRPDIQAAEAQLHRATAQIGVAKAELYPSITLTGNIGLDAYNRNDLGEWASRTWSVGPRVYLPLFNRGRLHSVVHLRELQQQEAAVNYHQTVLRAWQNVDDTLTAYSAARMRTASLTREVAYAQSAYQLATSRYSAGITDYMAVLDAERQYLQARHDLIDSRKQVYIEFVAVNKALGRGTATP